MFTFRIFAYISVHCFSFVCETVELCATEVLQGKFQFCNAILILFRYLMHLPCFSLFQVCDSDTVLDPACTIEMLKILEDDPMVGGVGGDVQVKSAFERDQT